MEKSHIMQTVAKWHKTVDIINNSISKL